MAKGATNGRRTRKSNGSKLAAASVGLVLSFAPMQGSGIIGGTDAPPGQYPWMISLVQRKADDAHDGHFCGATLIHPRWVMTAAHCFRDHFRGRVNRKAAVDLVIGRHDLRTTGGRRIAPARVVGHPDWAPRDFPKRLPDRNDILLLELPHAITDIEPVKLPGPAPSATSLNPFLIEPGLVTTAVGWGFTDVVEKQNSPVLQQVDLPVVTQGVCAAVQTDYPLQLQENTFCAGLKAGGRDNCIGDSGGPLLRRHPGGGSWVQVGITSYRQGGCAQPGFYGVYTRVSHHASWISDTACSTEEKPAQPSLDIRQEGHRVTARFASPGPVEGYRLYANPSGSPDRYLDLGPQTSFSIGLPPGGAWSAAVQAYNGICLSPLSEVKEVVGK